MKGRIYIGMEGISATITGRKGQMMAYKMYLAQHEFFNKLDDVDIKSSKVDGHKFPRMVVKYREGIVVLGKKDSKQEIEEAGNRMQIEELKDLIENGNPDDYVILDMRNNHEYRLGHLKNAIPTNTLNFRILDEQIDDYKKHLGFCSEECFNNSLSDILLKETDFDSVNYKMERAKIKKDVSLKQEVIDNVSKYLVKKLDGVVFNHKISQKEDFIMD